MLTYLRNPISGYEYSFWPDARFFYHYKIYRPLSFHTDWPITSREWYPEYWPSHNSYWHYLTDVPTEKSFRQLRVSFLSVILFNSFSGKKNDQLFH